MYELHLKSNWKKSLLFLFCNLFLLSFSSAQDVKDSSLYFPMIKFSYALQLPGGNLAKRFGYNSNVSINVSMKTKTNFIYGLGGEFIFGNQIKENGILDSLKTSSGFIINQNGIPATVRLYERGFIISMHVGKMFSMLASNKNSGFVAYGGPVFFQHKIAVQDIGHQSPQLVDPYPKGYDRLTSGIGVHEFIGYVYLGNRRIINFFGGFEFTQAFTKSRRPFDYDLMRADTTKRKDLLYGFRIGWILPLYKILPHDYYYF